MPEEHPESRQREDRRNDAQLVRPLLVMGLIVCGGLLFFAYRGGGNPNVAQAPVTQTPATQTK